jgi:cobalt transporter subunit CbtA
MVQPLIAEAETYEKSSVSDSPGAEYLNLGNISHNHTGGSQPHSHEKNSHIHAEVVTQNDAIKDRTHIARAIKSDHHHSVHLEGGKSSLLDEGFTRSLYTLAANILTVVGYGLLMASGFTLYGGSISVFQGFIWGGAGFVSFAFLPGLGLPAELPGTAAADLLARQAWWLGTASLSVIGLALLVFSKSNLWRAIAILFLVIPHAIGAPIPEVGLFGVSPPELAAHFVMVSLFASAIMWGVLGCSAAFVFRWLSEQQTSLIVDPYKVRTE